MATSIRRKTNFKPHKFLKINCDRFLELDQHVYLKEVNGIYKECNVAQANSFGLNDLKDVLGRSDNDFLPEEESCILKINDKEIIRTESPKAIVEYCTFANSDSRYMISFKMPVYGNNGKVIGVFGTSVAINNESFTAAVPPPLKNLIKTKHDLLTQTHKLSKRERECLNYLAQGLSAKKIARQLNLSPRTIEFYIANMKKKLSCANRAELVAKAFDLI